MATDEPTMDEMIGRQFGKLTVVERTTKKGSVWYYLCECECGTRKEYGKYNLTQGKSKSCGCANRESEDIVGKQFGRLTVLERTTKKGGAWYYMCRCECGKRVETSKSNLTSGSSTSCGCLRAQLTGNRFRKHGMFGTHIYTVWSKMKDRCSNPKENNYADYGGRGIRVCPEWDASFEAFHADMGYPPTERHTLDRTDNDGDYHKDNCRWATPAEQGSNKRNNRSLTVGGRTQTLAEWARETGVDPATIRYRLDHGRSDEEAIARPAVDIPRRARNVA